MNAERQREWSSEYFRLLSLQQSTMPINMADKAFTAAMLSRPAIRHSNEQLEGAIDTVESLLVWCAAVCNNRGIPNDNILAKFGQVKEALLWASAAATSQAALEAELMVKHS